MNFFKKFLAVLLIFSVCISSYALWWKKDKNKLNYPTKPISLVVPYDAGGSADAESRLISDLVSKKIGQPINLIFKPGGANIPGIMEVLNAPADGYTMLWWATPPIAINPYLRDTPYSADDLQPIVTVIENPVMLFVRKNSDINNLNEFLNKIRSANFTVGINTIGSVPYMAAAQLEAIGGLQFKYITQKTNPAAAVALIGGHVDVAFGVGPQLTAYPDDIKAIAVFSYDRSSSFPDVPTAKEQGYEVFAPVQSGIAFKKGIPTEISDFMEKAYLAVLASDEYKNLAKERGMFVASESAWNKEATEKNWKSSIKIYSDLIKKLGLKQN